MPLCPAFLHSWQNPPKGGSGRARAKTPPAAKRGAKKAGGRPHKDYGRGVERYEPEDEEPSMVRHITLFSRCF